VSTIGELVRRVLRAHAALAATGETVADEWQYVQDLRAAWGARLNEVVVARGTDPVPPAGAAAIDWLVEETARISDPHRAIDWLSTLPQAALVAFGERTF
jgi:hypothetical protein